VCRQDLAEILNKVYLLMSYPMARHLGDREHARRPLYQLLAGTARRDRVRCLDLRGRGCRPLYSSCRGGNGNTRSVLVVDCLKCTLHHLASSPSQHLHCCIRGPHRPRHLIQIFIPLHPLLFCTMTRDQNRVLLLFSDFFHANMIDLISSLHVGVSI
jgi:hypothetical protein